MNRSAPHLSGLPSHRLKPAALATAAAAVLLALPLPLQALPIFGSYSQASGEVTADAHFNGQATPNEASFISGAGTVLRLVGAVDGSPYFDRLGIGQTTIGALTVSAGAWIDAAQAGPGDCPLNRCNSSVGNGAGSTGTLTITGAGSRVDLINTLGVGRTTVQPGFGTPGGTTHGSLFVLDGGRLSGNELLLTVGPAQPPIELQDGSERSFAAAVVDGAGSLLHLTHNTTTGARARLVVGNGLNTSATLDVRNGARTIVDGTADTTASGVFPGVNIAYGAGSQGTVRVDDANLAIKGNTGFINVAASNQGNNGVGVLEVTGGGSVSGDGGLNDLQSLNIGGGNGTGGVGSVLVSGAHSLISLYANSGDGSATPGAAPVLNIGRGSGTGAMRVQDGGLLSMAARPGATTSVLVNIGRDGGSTGSLALHGAQTSMFVGGTDGRSPAMYVGRRGSGSLAIEAGAVMVLDSNAISNLRNSQVALNIGGGLGETGGTGTALVTGAGSRIYLNGDRLAPTTVLTVGRGAATTGSLSVSDGGVVDLVTVGVVGLDGGSGSVQLDNGTLKMWGTQFVTGAGADTGPALVLGRNGGTGSLSMSNGAFVDIEAPGLPSRGGLYQFADGFTAVSLGGTAVSVAGGSGTLQMSGGSVLTLHGGTAGGTANNATFSGLYIGRIGSGVMTVSGAGTRVDTSGLGNGGRVMVGVEPFGVNTGTGTLTVADNALVNAGRLLGVAHDGAVSSGGTGRLVLNSGGTVQADEIYIGHQGTVSGDGGLLIGDVISNQGVISPGLSPGRLTIRGGYRTQGSGSIVLEIASDGAGGFITDSLLFEGVAAADLDFAGTAIEFAFLGAADPLAFAATAGDTLAGFFLVDNGSGTQGIGALGDLDDLFAGVSYTARSDAYQIDSFTFTASGGFGALEVSPVPEPGAALLMLAGLAALGWRRRAGGAGHAA